MRFLKSLYVQVLIGVVAGVLVGALWPHFGASLKPLGDGFIRLIKMVVGPVVFCTVASGIAHMGDIRKFGRVGIKALIYFEVVSTLALVIGLGVATLLHPGSGFAIDVRTLNAESVAGFVQKAHAQTVQGYFLGLIPETFMGAFAGGELLQIVLLAVLTGFSLVALGDGGQRALTILDTVAKVFFAMIAIIVRVAPIGAFGAMAFTIGMYGTGALLKLGSLVATFYVTALLFVAIVLGLVARLVGFSLLKFLAYIREELLVVLGTSSSESVLPQLMTKLERLGVPKPVVGLVVPTGYSFNLDGTNIYITLAALFLAQATNTPLNTGQVLTLLLVAMLTSKGASGVTGAGFITLAATLSTVPTIPVSSLALIVGVDRFMSECRSLTNTIGNGVATLAVARWDGSLDRDQLTAELSGVARKNSENPMNT